MNRLMMEIKECMFDLSETAKGVIYARFLFPDGFIGFQGHFPDRPVLPGVCKIQAVMVIMQTWYKRKIKLKEIVLAKFFSTVTSREELVFECREHAENNNEFIVKAFVTSDCKKIAEIKLKMGFEG